MKQSWIFNNRVQLFLYDLNEVLPPVPLSKEEMQKAEGMTSPPRKKSFLFGRSIVKKHLSELLSIEPNKIVISERSDGRPFLKSPAHPVSWSLSHSHDHLLLAIDPHGAPLGADLERLSPDIDFQILRKHLYSEIENETIEALPIETQAGAALEYWCLKEARFKMRGNSASVAPNEISVSGPIGSQFYYAVCSEL